MTLIRYESLIDALTGTDAPVEITCELVLVQVPYISFEGNTQEGQLVIHHELADEVREIFSRLHEQRFPIQKMVPIGAYAWDDEASMADNNTSSFNYRRIVGVERLSKHATGRAIDINPLLNPYFATNGKVYPQEATYNPEVPGTLIENSEVVALFKELRWEWGGEWSDRKDYQHFAKK